MSTTTTPEALEALGRNARANDDPSALLAAIPLAAFLGIEMRREDGVHVAKMPYRDELIGDSSLPALHGGTIATLLECSATFAVLWAVDAAVLPKTITLTIDYLRSGRPVDTFCRARIVRQGRRVLVVESIAYQESPDRPIATAIVHVLVAGDEVETQ